MEQTTVPVNIKYWNLLSQNPTVSIYDVIDNLEKPWDWDELSRNRGISFRDINHYKTFSWNWRYVSRNENVTMKDVLDNPSYAWDFSALSGNPGIKFQDILDHPEFDWSWDDVSENINITTQNVLNHPDFKWNMDLLSTNPAIDMKLIESRMDERNFTECFHEDSSDDDFGEVDDCLDYIDGTDIYVIQQDGVPIGYSDSLSSANNIMWDKARDLRKSVSDSYQTFICEYDDDYLHLKVTGKYRYFFMSYERMFYTLNIKCISQIARV